MKWITQAKHATQFAFIENDKKEHTERGQKGKESSRSQSKTYATGPNLNPRTTHTETTRTYTHTERELRASSVAVDETMRHWGDNKPNHYGLWLWQSRVEKKKKPQLEEIVSSSKMLAKSTWVALEMMCVCVCVLLAWHICELSGCDMICEHFVKWKNETRSTKWKAKTMASYV